ncbi:SDR family NAD(P)-dependent oxidoreductase [Pseudotabrizicola algicola]|uniref:SDR family oxidoreductase n=1 Tax=Pseudotabrizicola algicola TaxID=2709381 RepID=A0A6B3RNA8_9RHOB|nr:SDR family oxidoreductase [Pseudotabrizicola algicola]NEX46683.1 SDR family oxidoreductase [Pseudotabrizicola algicola]
MSVIQDLAGRTAVVTGAAGGLGRVIAERLAASGARIVALDLPEMLEALPPEWEGVAVDLADPAAPARMQAVAARLGPVAVVVANAGLVPPWRGVTELDAAEWHRVMTVNVWGVASTLGSFADALAASGHGSAIIMASINGFRAHPRQMLYTASKHAAIGVMRAAAMELGPRGVRVNALAPGPIATEALISRIVTRHENGGPAPEVALAALAADTMLGRMATPEDVANLAHFLASDAAAGLTGHVYPVEAGLP